MHVHAEARSGRYKDAMAAGRDWRVITSAEVNKLANGKRAGAGTQHKYDPAMWPSALMTEAAAKLVALGLPRATTELVAEVTINPDDRITAVPSIKTFTVDMVGGTQETRYHVVVSDPHDMKEVLRHMRKADPANRASAARLFFRPKAAA